jgi:hypothetical protein
MITSGIVGELLISAITPKIKTLKNIKRRNVSKTAKHECLLTI